MKRFYLSKLLIVLSICLIGLDINAQITESVKNNPDWDRAADWSSGAPGYKTNQDARLINDGKVKEDMEINDSVWISADMVFEKKVIKVKSGGVLIVEGSLELDKKANMEIEDGGTFCLSGEFFCDECVVTVKKATFVIKPGGSFTATNKSLVKMEDDPATIVVDGSMFVEEELSVKVDITGDGTIIVDDNFDNDGGDIFGCTSSGDGCCTDIDGLCFLGSVGLVFRSVKDGEWTDPSTWDINLVPTDRANVVISAGDSVYLEKGGKVVLEDFTIEKDGILIQDERDLECKNSYVNNGFHLITKKELEIEEDGTYISGNGLVQFEGSDNKAKIQIKDSITIIDTADILFFGSGVNGGVEIEGTLVNYGTVGFSSETSKGGEFINKTGANLFVYAPEFGVDLFASDSGNTVHYSDITDQEIKVPEASTYYNLQASGGNVKTLTGDIIVTNMVIESTLDVDSSENYDITVKGFWNNSGGEFLERLGKVTFDGSGDQKLQGSVGIETFYDLEINKLSLVLIFKCYYHHQKFQHFHRNLLSKPL